MPDARRHFVDEIVVMGDEQHRTLVVLQRDVQRIDGFEVEVVGWLVERKDVWLLHHQTAEDQPRGLAAGERIGWLEPFFAAEEHLAEDAADVLIACLRIEAMQPLGNRGALVDQAGNILREVADLRLVAPLHGARRRPGSPSQPDRAGWRAAT